VFTESAYETILLNGSLENLQAAEETAIEGDVIYEVIRVKEGVPLFLSEHIARMDQSMILSGFENILSAQEVAEGIRKLKQELNICNQNVKVIVWRQSGVLNWAAFFVPSQYPKPAVYEKGVSTGLLHMERDNPNAKVWNAKLKETVGRLCREKEYYEMILVSDNGQITEGSRSNLFFIRGNTLITAPAETVLEGITRKVLMTCIEQAHIPVEFRCIAANELEQMDGAFLTGTSIHVLPIAHIDAQTLNSSNNPVFQTICRIFEDCVQEHLKGEFQ